MTPEKTSDKQRRVTDALHSAKRRRARRRRQSRVQLQSAHHAAEREHR